MKKIIVLGSGLVGNVMASDLAEKHQVTSVDISKENLDKIHSKKINKICADVLEKDVLETLIKDFDLVVGALPGFMGYNTMKRAIEAMNITIVLNVRYRYGFLQSREFSALLPTPSRGILSITRRSIINSPPTTIRQIMLANILHSLDSLRSKKFSQGPNNASTSKTKIITKIRNKPFASETVSLGIIVSIILDLKH